jgi:hypothetical protein
MSFTPNIPASGQSLGNSRTQILNNFAALRETISNGSGSGSGQPNHVDVNDNLGVGAGKHIFVQMPVQTAGAGNLPAAQEGGMITQTTNGSSELYYARDAVNTYYQMTGPFFNAEGALLSGGTTMLFGGIILKWGVISNNIAGPVNIVFATECGSAFPNSVYTINWNSNIGVNATISNITTTGFTLTGTSNIGNIIFTAIGR